MTGTTKRTTDHATIRRWAEERGATPAAIRGASLGHEASGLRLIFPDRQGLWMETITWDDFFRIFEEKQLDFLYQDVTREGERSDFFKLINRTSRVRQKAA